MFPVGVRAYSRCHFASRIAFSIHIHACSPLCTILIQLFNECVAHYKLTMSLRDEWRKYFRAEKMVWFVFGLLTKRNTQYFIAGSILSRLVVAIRSAYSVPRLNTACGMALKHTIMSSRQAGRQHQKHFLTPTTMRNI